MKPTFQKMFQRQTHDRVFIRVQRRRLAGSTDAAEINHRHTQFANRFGHGRSFDTCDDTVPVPSIEPSRQGALQLPFVRIDLPMTALVNILGHAQKQAAAIRA